MPAVLLLLLLAAGYINAWKYSGHDKPEGWAGTCTDGRHQSPIDLVTETMESFIIEPLEFFNYKSLNGTITNNGHSIAVHFDEDSCDSGVTAGMLRGQYVLHEMHFHWESEHTINGKRFPLELHLVHFNSKYGDMKHAMHYNDGLAVVGVIYQEFENGTDILDPFLEAVQGVSRVVQGKGHLPPHFNPIDFLPTDKSSFFRYSGSLTTPPCSEIVTWTIMETKMPISSEQVKIFRELKSEHGVVEHNYRRLQDINDRVVYLLSDNGAASACSVLSVIVFSALFVLQYS